MNSQKLSTITFILLFIFSIPYFPLIVQVPYSFFQNDFRQKSLFSRKLEILEKGASFLKNEPEIGFISDVNDDYVLLESGPILNFYIAQYAFVPAIVKKGTNFPYTIGIYDKIIRIENGISVFRQISPDIFIFTRRIK